MGVVWLSLVENLFQIAYLRRARELRNSGRVGGEWVVIVEFMTGIYLLGARQKTVEEKGQGPFRLTFEMWSLLSVTLRNPRFANNFLTSREGKKVLMTWLRRLEVPLPQFEALGRLR